VFFCVAAQNQMSSSPSTMKHTKGNLMVSFIISLFAVITESAVSFVIL